MTEKQKAELCKELSNRVPKLTEKRALEIVEAIFDSGRCITPYPCHDLYRG